MGLTRPKSGQINFDATNITDPLIRINSGQSGANDKDAGWVIERGSDSNVALMWDESADEFALISTAEDGTTSGNVTITSYANIRANEFYGDGSNLSGISTTTTLAALTDTTISNPQDDHFLRYNGSAWINEAVTLTSTVAALTDTTISGPSSGQVLKYNGSAWINDSDSATTTVTLSEMTGDGSDTTLTLEATPSSDDNLLVFVDSVLQDAGAWSRSDTTLTFSEAPANGAVIKAWDLLSSTATNAAKLDALTADGSTVAFTLQQSSSDYTPSHANCLLVSVAGVLQEPGAGKAFTVSGSTITFSTAPATGATIWIVDVGGGVTVNTPADNSVTGAKIAMTSDAQGDVLFYGGTDYERLPAGTSGYFLKTLGSGADPAWAEVPAGAPTGGGTEKVFYENENSVDTDYTLTTNYNAVSAGPVTVASGVTVTVPSGSTWVVI